MNTEGCKNLINAIYIQAANDYIFAVVSNKKDLERETGSFLSCYERGKYIKKKCLEEIKICKQFINDFLESDSKKILIDESNISIPVLRIVVSVRYREQVKVNVTKKDECYMMRKN